MLILLQQATGSYLSEFLFCVLWKIAFHHPVIVLRFGSQYISNSSALVFTKIEYLNTIFHYKASCKINDRFFTDQL